MSGLMGVGAGSAAVWEGLVVGAGVHRSTTSIGSDAATDDSMEFQTATSAADCSIKAAFRSDLAGHGMTIFTAYFKVADLDNITSPLRIISSGGGADERVWTIDSDGLQRLYDNNDNLLATSDTALVDDNTFQRIAFIICNFDHGGGKAYYWLAQDVSGSLTEVAFFQADRITTTTGPWNTGAGSDIFYWGEDLPAATNRGTDFNLAHAITTWNTTTDHATEAPHIAAIPFGVSYAQDHSADGATAQWTLVGTAADHSDAWQVDDGDTEAAKATGAGEVGLVDGDAVTGLAASDDVYNGPHLRASTKYALGEKGEYKGSGSVDLSGTQVDVDWVEPPSSYDIDANGEEFSRPGGGDWDGGDVTGLEYGLSAGTPFGGTFSATAVCVYWVKETDTFPVLSVPPASLVIPRHPMYNLIGR